MEKYLNEYKKVELEYPICPACGKTIITLCKSMYNRLFCDVYCIKKWEKQNKTKEL